MGFSLLRFITVSLAGVCQALLSPQDSQHHVADCLSSAVQSLIPLVPGTSVVSVTATAALNISTLSGLANPNLIPISSPTVVSFCNITVTYNHPNWNDHINLSIFLPLSGWNGKFVATGGSGLMTGPDTGDMLNAIALGFATGGTDGGHTGSDISWAVEIPGQLVNLPVFTDFASESLKEIVLFGRPLTESFFGKSTKFTYWAGCSTGGRQGLMMAQRYSELFDGIVANSPAINWGQFVISELWPQIIMEQTNTFPPACVLEAFTSAAIAECDGIDGLIDGIIDAPGLCNFDPTSIVGQEVNCSGTEVLITDADAFVVSETLRGAHTVNGTFLWFGLDQGTDMTALAGTLCTGVTDCIPLPFPISSQWIASFLAKNASFDTSELTIQQFSDFFAQSVQEYEWLIGTNNPDLRHLRQTNTKVLTFHGLADQLIFPNGTIQYYESVLGVDANAADYYRFFEAPGVMHCGGGIGPNPTTIFTALQDWVENGNAPIQLAGVSKSTNGTIGHQPLCLYPLVSVYQGGDPTLASSYMCQENFNRPAS